MNSTRLILAFATTIGMFLVFSAAQAQNGAGRIDSAFQKFWATKSPDEAERLSDDIVKTGATFDEALRRLKAGRTYTAQKTGIVKLSNKTKEGVEHFYALTIPANYDPEFRYQV